MYTGNGKSPLINNARAAAGLWWRRGAITPAIGKEDDDDASVKSQRGRGVIAVWAARELVTVCDV